MNSAPLIRPTVRILMFDAMRRTLLFRGQDPSDPSVRFWFPPGGGIEDGETVREAARREVFEETGLADFELGPHIWNRRHVVEFNGAHTDIRETWLLAHVPNFDIDISGFSDLEKLLIPEHRWWTQDDLESTTETLTPRDLARLTRDLLRSGPPSTPVTVDV